MKFHILRYHVQKPIDFYKSFFGASPFSSPEPYFFTGSLAAPLSFSKYFTSSLFMYFITLSACHFLKLKPKPSWL